jgi:alpha-L-fucosidase 2
VNYWDHLHDGKQAYDSLQVMFRQSTFPNLMDTHPPGLFQIDSNLGAANGMLEALVQSRWMSDASEIELLPALPPQWADGSAEGLRVRGGATVDMRWKNGKVQTLELHAKADATVRLITPGGQSIAGLMTDSGQVIAVRADGVVSLKNGTSYQVALR